MDSSAAAGVPMEDAFGVLLRRSVLVVAPLGAVCAVVGGLVTGWSGAVSAAIGAAIVILFFGARLVVMRRMASRNPQLVLMTALGIYTAKIVVLGVLMVVLTKVSWIDGRWLGITVLATAMVWLLVEMLGIVRMRVPIFVPTGSEVEPRERAGR